MIVYKRFQLFMKKQRQKLKTDYDDQGNIDHQQYIKLQTNIFHKEIDFSLRYQTKTTNDFSIRPLQIDFMQSTALKDEPKFKQIKKILIDYNKHALDVGQIVQDSHLYTKVIDSLLKFMRLMMLAPDTKTKKLILDISYDWMIQHLDPKSKRINNNDALKMIKDVLVKKALVPLDVINKQLIHNKMNDELKLYRSKARTVYKQLDAPKYQLANYHTHKLQFINQKNQNTNQYKSKWIDTVKFPAIQKPGYYYVQEEPEMPDNLDKQQIKIEQNRQNAPQLAQQKKDNMQTHPTQGNQTKQGQQVTIQQNQQQDLDFGAPNQDDQAQVEEIQQPEDKKRGKLDPLVKVFLLQRIKQKEKSQYRAENTLLKKNNKLNRTHQEQFDEVAYMNNWAKMKTRFKTQASRKNQSLKVINQISNSIHKQDTFKDKYLESDMKKLKIKKTLHQNLKNISQIQIPPQKLNTQVSNSIFDRRRIKTQYSRKPFSSILAEHQHQKEREQMLEEISDMKQRFSKAKIYTPYDNLVKGLINPISQSQTTQDTKFVWPNSNMLSNPFIKVKKKKKKKKKK